MSINSSKCSPKLQHFFLLHCPAFCNKTFNNYRRMRVSLGLLWPKTYKHADSRLGACVAVGPHFSVQVLQLKWGIPVTEAHPKLADVLDLTRGLVMTRIL